MKSYRPSTLNSHHKMSFQVSRCIAKSKIESEVHRVGFEESTRGKDSHIVSSRMLKRASPYSSTVLEAYTGKFQNVKAVDGEGKRRRVNPAIFQRKVHAVVYSGESLVDKYTHDSFYNRLSRYDDFDRAKVTTAVSDCNSAGSSDQNDLDYDACSIGSCSINSRRADKLSNCSLAVPCVARDLLSCDAESFCYSYDEEENGSHCLEETVEVSIHKLELHAYHSTLEALYASGPLSWEKELLLTDLRIMLHISNDEHLTELKNLIFSGST